MLKKLKLLGFTNLQLLGYIVGGIIVCLAVFLIGDSISGREINLVKDVAATASFAFLCWVLYKIIAEGVATGVESAMTHATSQITDAIKNSKVSDRDIERVITAIGRVTTATESNRVQQR